MEELLPSSNYTVTILLTEKVVVTAALDGCGEANSIIWHLHLNVPGRPLNKEVQTIDILLQLKGFPVQHVHMSMDF